MITFALFDSAGAPLVGASPSFAMYVDAAGAPRASPPITEVAPGLYCFTPETEDEQLGTAYLIDGGAIASPRYYSGGLGPLVAFAFYGASNAPLAGLTPRFISYTAGGAARTPPPVVELGGGLYGFEPSPADRESGTVYVVAGGAGAEPAYYSGTVPAIVPEPEIPDVAQVVVASERLTILQGATWRVEFVARKKDGTPLDLTGYAARMQIRPHPGGEIYAEAAVAITDAARGIVAAFFSAAETDEFAWRFGIYDVEVHAAGTVLRIASGRVRVSPQITT